MELKYPYFLDKQVWVAKTAKFLCAWVDLPRVVVVPFCSRVFCSWHQNFSLEHCLLCLVHMLIVVHVLTLVNVHHHRYDVQLMATLVPDLNVSM